MKKSVKVSKSTAASSKGFFKKVDPKAIAREKYMSDFKSGLAAGAGMAVASIAANIIVSVVTGALRPKSVTPQEVAHFAKEMDDAMEREFQEDMDEFNRT